MSLEPNSPKKRGRPRKIKNDSVDSTESQIVSSAAAQNDIPDNQQPLPLPINDKKTVSDISKFIELSYIEYLKEISKSDSADTNKSVLHLGNMISEFATPFMLIGYLPNGEPIEITYAVTARDKEALFERLRKTFFHRAGGGSIVTEG